MNQEIQQRMRFMPTGMKVRESEDGSDSRVLEGCAVVFGQETTLWDGDYYKLREIINASCVTEEFMRQQDVKLNLLHNRADSVARYKEGVSDSLHWEIREDGLYWWAEMPKCDIGDRALELVRNKTYTGCSFEFYAEEYTETTNVDENGKQDTLIEHTKMNSITALTIAMDPAYAQTSVNERENYQKREAEIKAARESHQDDAEVEFQREVQRAKREARKALRETKVNTLW